MTLTGDYRDIDLTAGWSPENADVKEFFAIEAAYGNGFLDRLEHREQYKFNGFRVFNVGNHQVTVLGLGYYGFSYVPGLVPTDIPNLHDTIDKRQRDQTHTADIASNDVWKLTPSSELQSLCLLSILQSFALFKLRRRTDSSKRVPHRNRR